MTTPADTSELRGALERRGEPQQARTIRDLIERQKPELARVLPASIPPDRLARVALTELRRTPKLLECTPESLLGALMLSAQLGLEPGPLGHVYLVPFGSEVQFILGYKGMIDLAYRSGDVRRIESAIVREGDLFEWRRGSRAFLDHTPTGPPAEREWTHVYALAQLRSGGVVFEVLFPEDVAARKRRSASAKRSGGPWDTDTAAMWRKSAVRALAPMLPQSAVFARGVNADESVPTVTDDAVLDITDPEGGSDDE